MNVGKWQCAHAWLCFYVFNIAAHKFEKLPENGSHTLPCCVCKGLWAPTNKLANKYYVCISCGQYDFHACEVIFRRFQISLFILLARALLKYTSNVQGDKLFRQVAVGTVCSCFFQIKLTFKREIGRIMIRFQHMYDIPVTSGIYIYGRCKSVNFDRVIQTTLAVIGENDALWHESQDADCTAEFTYEPDIVDCFVFEWRHIRRKFRRQSTRRSDI